ncbi:MAG TPA: TRAP transporter large permease subunit [Usitatibacter sp.]|nr:TRAP transporter large permease subunit [Usitatibacter sp.]
MSDPALGLLMLSLIVVAIMMGFPTAFTLMGLGMVFGFVALHEPGQAWTANHVFDLMVQRTFGAMTNDVLISIPLFVLMGYVMERGALVDKMFYSVQLAFRRVPASLAVATLVICTFWGIASGLVGAVVVLMGVIAMGPMLKAGYDVRLASGVITAGGTLGILIPPSVMIIVYAAVAGQSVVKLYAAAMFPGFFLSFLYLIYIIGWAILNPKIAPKLPPEQQRAPVPPEAQAIAMRHRNMPLAILGALAAPGAGPALASSAGAIGTQARVAYGVVLRYFGMLLVPLAITLATFGGLYWYVVIHPMADQATSSTAEAKTAVSPPPAASTAPGAGASAKDEPLQELGGAGVAEPTEDVAPDVLEEVGTPSLQPAEPQGEAAKGAPQAFYYWFWGLLALSLVAVFIYYARMDAESFIVLKLLTESVMPLGILTVVVLAVILFGITTATESAAVGAFGAFLLAFQAKTLDFQRVKESVFLTAKTTAMVCWLFVGSALFSAVFAILGGQQLVEKWVLGLNLTPVQFMILSQAVIFVLGWPLEWTEIIVIFVPIFLPMLQHFHIDPILWGTLVFVNLQAAFLSPPVAMSAFYLKGVSPPHVTLNQIFAGMMPYMLIVILCMVIMYFWPGMTLWLPNYLYGGA